MALTDKLTAIANAIRAKTGKVATMTLAEMPTEIASISGGGITPTGTKNISITQNGTTTEDVTNYAYAQIAVNVSGGGGNAITGTFSPSEDLRSITLSDIIGKTNVAIFPQTTLAVPSGMRGHWGETFISGKCTLLGSSNTAGTGLSFNYATDPSVGITTNASTLDSTTGTVEIVAGVSANYGGYYSVGTTYRYLAW